MKMKLGRCRRRAEEVEARRRGRREEREEGAEKETMEYKAENEE